jgi:hypothetical protein
MELILSSSFGLPSPRLVELPELPAANPAKPYDLPERLGLFLPILLMY